MINRWLQCSVRALGAAAVACALFMMPAGFAQAQAPESGSASAPQFTYGVRVGANVSGVTGDNIAIEESSMRPIVGAFLSLPLTSWVGVQPEVAYRPHDVKLSTTQQFSAQTWQYTTHYLAVPVLLKWYVPSPGTSQLHVLTGPDIAFKLGENVDLASSRESELSPAFGNSFSSTDIGAVVGVGFDRNASGRVFSLDVRYEIGLTELTSDSDVPSLHDRSFSITFGIGL